jgi:hypothetical protein
MWNKNPHGAGFMYARSKYVYIKKGYMSFDAFYDAVQAEHFTKDDVVVYHFRISTQGGVNPEMTHPFVLSDKLEDMKILHTRTNIGICHNGIICLTSNGDSRYSDTAYFITDYLSGMVEKPSDLKNSVLLHKIESLIGSKMAFLDYAGNVNTVGTFVTDVTGLKFSNSYFMPYSYSSYVA